jgi:hypothetical protein
VHNHLDFQKTVLIVAHPDDEVLWFSSILGRVNTIVICYLLTRHPDFLYANEGRLSLIDSYPLKNARFLGLFESMAEMCVDWDSAVWTDYGITLSGDGDRQYLLNYEKLCSILPGRLRGFDHVFTSSPWGEYGHPEHIMLNSVIKRLQKGLHYTMWYPAYMSDRSERLRDLAMKKIQSLQVTLPTDLALAHCMRDHYMKLGCWTYLDGHVWPVEETFIKDAEDDGSSSPFFFHRLP